ncbi:homocysteine S-methyltransferase [Saccharibacillus alkalitolerans]|uniref:Homocysteine S-methyltransferase n=1 Tax=Saccharibacillus alkalitolerans TaxID=2705290 RepID=A0ABX0FA49_9BACL|nr:homocysteine S-methyltransferase [Saccharibacillus alkalitolerans]NGZ77812.1 homocysteine S-methyltransferase [Saccharibacillus alkalitolerans]
MNESITNHPINPIQAILERYPVLILDGALATELERHGCDLNDPLWSARVLLERPELIRRVHADYFRAGADCAITASYQATVEGFAAQGVGEERALELIRRTVTLAAEARDEFWAAEESGDRPKPFVAASVGPYGAYLADGSEYVGHYGVEDERLASFHRPRMRALVEAGADLLAFETIPSLQEARVLADLLEEFPGTFAWMSFSLRDGGAISEGTPLEECARALEAYPFVAAVGINCAPSSAAAEAAARLAASTSKPILVYPNSGETYDPSTKTWKPGAAEACGGFAESARAWHEAGARLIGGCCRTTPEQIARIAAVWRS